MNKSTYCDFSQTIVILWIIQSIIFKNVSFYFDNKNKAYCRQIKNVKGKIIFDENIGRNAFYPDPGQIVSYTQWL